ncbi:hypothetical protein NQ318_009871 [Aromia moschata]|uniref:thioredoxin-dependent peroxiredoxin n=1 Tax=Aromia moschata TaxID=1265417 RepID=A0AAV8Y1V4_9CUCU|nr:hypothetical protein NQ318_009871 [Aromia moschata]
MPALKLGQLFPNFGAESTKGYINFYEWQNNKWVVLFSHPKDFTPVCTSELSKIADQEPIFYKRDVKFLAHSCDSLKEHLAWEKDIIHYCWGMPTSELPFPIIADEDKQIAKMLDLLDASSSQDQLGLTRALYIIDPRHVLRFSLHYPATTGRSIKEILRIIESLQLTDRMHQVQTPVNWTVGDKVLIKPNVPEHEVKKSLSPWNRN